jgi:hypothetical protein
MSHDNDEEEVNRENDCGCAGLLREEGATSFNRKPFRRHAYALQIYFIVDLMELLFMSVGQMSVSQMCLSAKALSAKCLSFKCLWAKCLSVCR